ncbi:MAG TPA: hypothetical protein VGV37_17645 [Aliidongia sp.]|uniref:hypothetical protein n=1 Tax=Aliidongia sp. TaxID=1914230 RepID=UPI002DDD6D18|nr:hypothetical protein [Aliidongia sp.]HEV2676354.1 hypothetical protein [Aliidongia sp.]
MKRAAATLVTLGLLAASGAWAQTTPGGAGTSADPSVSTTRTGLSPAESGAKPTLETSRMTGAGVAQPPNAVPTARNTAGDPHTGHTKAATGAATSDTPGGNR